MTAERWRCFVAAPIDDDVRAAMVSATEQWEAIDGLRRTPPESWHITLAFLGTVDAAAVATIRAVITEVARRHEPMRLAAEGLGAFPSAARARVAWYGIDDGAGRLAALARDLAAGLGLDGSMPFKAHITLARASRGSADVRGWLDAASASAPALTLKLRRLDLMRSHLGSGAPRYETLAIMELGGGARA